MDIVYINDLKVDTVIGIFDWERRIRQTVSLDLEMAADIRKGPRRITLTTPWTTSLSVNG